MNPYLFDAIRGIENFSPLLWNSTRQFREERDASAWEEKARTWIGQRKPYVMPRCGVSVLCRAWDSFLVLGSWVIDALPTRSDELQSPIAEIEEACGPGRGLGARFHFDRCCPCGVTYRCTV